MEIKISEKSPVKSLLKLDERLLRKSINSALSFPPTIKYPETKEKYSTLANARMNEIDKNLNDIIKEIIEENLEQLKNKINGNLESK